MEQQSSKSLQEGLLNSSANINNPVLKQPASFFTLLKYSTSKEKLMMIIGAIAAAIAGAGFPFFAIFFGDVTVIFNDADRSNASSNGFNLFVKLLIIGGVSWLSSFIGLYCWSYSGANQSLRIKKIYYKTLLEQQVAWYDQNDVNKLATTIASNTTAIQNAIGQKIALLLSTTVTSVFGFFYAYFKCWELSLVLTGTLPLLMIAGILLMKALTLSAQKGKVSYENAAGRAEQTFGGIKTVKSLVGESFELAKFTNALSEGIQKSIKYNFYSAGSLGFMTLIFLSVYALGFWYGKILVNDLKYDAPTVLGTFFCFIIGGSTIGQISPILKNIAEGKTAMADLLQIENRPKTLVQPENGIKIKKIEKIELKDVDFSYKSDNLVLKRVSINFGEGKVSALVGESGCGKSTIVQLLMRFYDAVNGQVFINGNNIKDININNYRKKIGFVGQEPVLFAMSIQDNLRLSNPKLTEQQIIQALKKANAWEFVQKMQKGIKTYVGANGAQLSGGQKQRIAIARAICKDPHILILDEATSALDRKNEKEIQNTLKSLEENKITTIVIAHRLSTIKNADKIYVLSKGEVVERGTHQELLTKNECYATLVKTQLAVDNNEQSNEFQNTNQMGKASEVIQSQKGIEQKNEVAPEKINSAYGKLFKLSKPNIKFIILGALGSLLSGSIWPFFNIAFSNVLAFLADPTKQHEINMYCLLFLAVAIFGGLTTFTYSFSFGVAGQRLVYDLRLKAFDKLLRLPVSFYDNAKNTPGAVSTKLATDAYQVNNMITGVVGTVCLNISTISISLILAFYYSWKLTLIVLGLSPLLVIAGAIDMQVVKSMAQKSQDSDKFVGSLISDTVCNIRTVKSFGNPKYFLKKFEEKLQQIINIDTEKSFKRSFFQAMSQGMIIIVEGLLFWIAALLFQSGQIDNGSSVFIAIFSIIFAAMGVGQNSQFMPDMAKGKLAAAGLFDIIQSKGEDQISIEQGGLIKQDLCGQIQFKNVIFKYPQRDILVLDQLSFKIREGAKAAFVGPSGSGKSTIAQLLMRFYQIQSGQILINGKNIKQYDLYHYRSQIGLVSQEPRLFLGTVKENIKYNQNISSEKIQQSVKIAHAHQFINQWEEKYEKEVGQMGGQVSGGQKQRIALSRCLVRNSRLLVFDEFTSALDADTERIVFQNLKPILKQKTSISIAHRLSTIEDAQSIIVLRDGKIVQSGNYQELMKKEEHFYRLAQGQ